jgi:hypothetical protein
MDPPRLRPAERDDREPQDLGGDDETILVRDDRDRLGRLRSTLGLEAEQRGAVDDLGAHDLALIVVGIEEQHLAGRAADCFPRDALHARAALFVFAVFLGEEQLDAIELDIGCHLDVDTVAAARSDHYRHDDEHDPAHADQYRWMTGALSTLLS